MSRRRPRNRDKLKRQNFPQQTYALSGSEWGDVVEGIDDAPNGKKTVDGPPMIITPTPPGAYAYDDEAWSQTFGASMDAFLTLYPGKVVSENNKLTSPAGSGISENSNPAYHPFTINAALVDSFPTADSLSLYKDASQNQQIQFLVSENTIDLAKSAQKTSDYATARGIGIRGPIQMGGWGRTVGMRPTDPDPENNRKNDDSHKLDASSWKFGPVDLRWDAKRRTWRGFNDLIADNPRSWAGEGTLVFGTNPDATCGFPFLKGKLEDVWWVRKTGDDTDPAAFRGEEFDNAKTAKVMTHLGHYWADVTYNKSGVVGLASGTLTSADCAPMSSIFLIHRSAGVEAEQETTCGDELTRFAPAIELKTSVYFHCSDDFGIPNLSPDAFDGPLNFICDRKPTPCELEQDGRLVFSNDKWKPAITINACSPCVAGDQFRITFDNDVALAKKICEICKLMLKLHGFKEDKPKPKQMKKAAAAAGKAKNSAQEAADAFGALPKTGPAPPSSPVELAQLTAAEEYQQSATMHAESESAQEDAAEAQAAANDAQATAEASQEAAESSGTESAKAQARTDRQAALDAQDAADAAKAAADKARSAAEESGKDAKKAHDDWKEEKAKANEDFTPDELEADRKAEQADKDAEEAAQAGKDANEAPDSAEDCCKKNAKAIEDLISSLGGGDGIAALGAGDVARPADVSEAINAAEQKINSAVQALIAAANEALASAIGDMNTKLAELGGTPIQITELDSEGIVIGQNAGKESGTGAGGAGTTNPGSDPSVSADPTGGGKTVPHPPADPDIPPPGGPGGGAGDSPDDASTPPEKPEPPDCGVIILKDPCGKEKIIHCEGDNTTLEGEPTGDGDGQGGGVLTSQLSGKLSGGTLGANHIL